MSESNTPSGRMRASHDDRTRVTERLAQAYADGRLDAEEFDERSAHAGAARWTDELDALTLDLGAPALDSSALAVPQPTPPPSAVTVHRGAHGSAWSVGVMGGQERTGRWTVAPRHNGVFIMGGGSIDLREAIFTSDEVVVTVTAIMGGCEIVVTPDTEVINQGFGIMGGFGGEPADRPSDPGRPRVRVRGLALMGGVGVVRREVGEDADDD